MAAKFHTTAHFGIKERSLFVVAGHVVDGIAAAGMRLQIPINGSIGFDEAVKSIEIVQTERGSLVALVFDYDDPDDLSLLMALTPDGADLDLADPTDSSAAPT